VNCLACRRLLLAAPREVTDDQRAHIEECRACARLAESLGALGASIEDAARVPVPDALAHRVLLARRHRPVWRHFALAASAVVLTVSVFLAADALDANPFSPQLHAVGPAHPAIAAISLVVDDRVELAQEGNTAEMHQRLRDLGLELKAGGVHAYYAGKCQLPGAECDLIVLDTPEARANVVLVPNYPIDSRVLVSDRSKTALVNPARTGGYIVVADSPKVAKRMRRLFIRTS
jgi:hypothetical protein